VALGIFHSDENEWYKKGQIKKLYHLYKELLDSFSLPESFALTTCCQCHIEFPTSFSNRGRTDLRCPFGCRQKHRKKKSNERSKAYYQTPEGKVKKQEQNSKRKTATQDKKVQEAKSIHQDLFNFLSSLLSVIIGKTIKQAELQELIVKTLKNLRQHPLEFLVDGLVLTGYD
jgi:hypothetical protein